MSLLTYGQPFGGIVQIAYFVEDIKKSIKEFIDVYNIGPWVVHGPFVPHAGRYRGKPTKVEVTLALAYSGHISIELIQQHNDEPSVFKETFAKRGYGFHHFAIVTKDFDAEIARYQAMGYEEAFADQVLDSRMAYYDTSAGLQGGMTEIIEYTPKMEALQSKPYFANLDWDGKDGVHHMPIPPPV